MLINIGFSFIYVVVVAYVFSIPSCPSCICHEMTFHVDRGNATQHFRDDVNVIITKGKLLMLQKCFSRCTNNRQCVNVSKVCDFRSDCSDSSDEANCPTTCNFENGYCKWTNAQVGDHYDWIRYKGKTPSQLTGPSTDHTFNTSAGLSHFLHFFYASSTYRSSDNHG